MAESREKLLDSFIRNAIPESKRDYNHAVKDELLYELPVKARSQFGDFLRQLSDPDKMTELGIQPGGLGISAAPLEDVFHRVGNETQVQNYAEERADADGIELGFEAGLSGPGGHAVYSTLGNDVQYTPDLWTQARGVFIHRMKLFVANLGIKVLKMDMHGLRVFLRDEPQGMRKLFLRGEMSRFVQLELGSFTALLHLALPLVASAFAIHLRTWHKPCKKKNDGLFWCKGILGQWEEKAGPTDLQKFQFGIVSAALVVAGYLFTPGFVGEILVKERSLKLRNLLTVMGCDAKAFWLGQFGADMLLWSIPTLIFWILLGAYDLKEWSGNGGAFFWMNIVFGLELHAFSCTLTCVDLLPHPVASIFLVASLLLVRSPQLRVPVVCKFHVAVPYGHSQSNHRSAPSCRARGVPPIH